MAGIQVHPPSPPRASGGGEAARRVRNSTPAKTGWPGDGEQHILDSGMSGKATSFGSPAEVMKVFSVPKQQGGLEVRRKGSALAMIRFSFGGGGCRQEASDENVSPGSGASTSRIHRSHNRI